MIAEGTVGNGFVPGLVAIGIMAAIVVALCINAERKYKKEQEEKKRVKEAAEV